MNKRKYKLHPIITTIETYPDSPMATLSGLRYPDKIGLNISAPKPCPAFTIPVTRPRLLGNH